MLIRYCNGWHKVPLNKDRQHKKHDRYKGPQNDILFHSGITVQRDRPCK